jgi:hypothetical protein
LLLDEVIVSHADGAGLQVGERLVDLPDPDRAFALRRVGIGVAEEGWEPHALEA